MPLYIEQSGDLDRCHRCLTDSLTHSQTLKDSATQLLIKYKSGALVTKSFARFQELDSVPAQGTAGMWSGEPELGRDEVMVFDRDEDD